MADTTDPGGGSTTIVCTPSPNDEVAIIHNLIKRISDIERFLNQLVGADVYANNLSELATDIGNILNGTIILPDTGSPLGPGGSIPVPDGFTGTVISGNVITTWTNGVVSFEVIPGTGITVGGGGGVSSAMYGNWSGISDTVAGSGTWTTLTIDTEFMDDLGLTLSGDAISGFTPGFYLVALHISSAGGPYQDVALKARVRSLYLPTLEYSTDTSFSSLTYGEVTSIDNMNLSAGVYIDTGASVDVQVWMQASSSADFLLESITFLQLNTTTTPPP